MNETFWSLLRDRAHWEFEIFLMLLFDGIIVGVCWPFARKHWLHHIARDHRDAWPEIQQKFSEDIKGQFFAVPPTPACVKCEGEAVVLDTSVVICKECGHVTVPPSKK